MKQESHLPQTSSQDECDVPLIASNRLITVRDLARLIGMSERWIHERTRRHEMPCYRFGTALRFDLKEIRAWIAKFHRSPGED